MAGLFVLSLIIGYWFVGTNWGEAGIGRFLPFAQATEAQRILV
jgi:hypothetical protein